MLTTDRLLLRGWRPDDAGALLAMSTDPEVMRFFPPPMSAEEATPFVDRQRAREAAGAPYLFVVETRDEPEFVGFVGLAEPAFEAFFTPCVEIGWRLVRAAWGKGYATEAGREVLRHAFDDRALPEVVSFTAVLNTPSVAVMRRLGMERVAEFDHPAVPAESPLRRHGLFRLSADRWRHRAG